MEVRDPALHHQENGVCFPKIFYHMVLFTCTIAVSEHCTQCAEVEISVYACVVALKQLSRMFHCCNI